jgi:S-adenosylmethionine synthetase
VSGYLFSSESVTEGHPDKVCDYISDSILDAYLAQDRLAHVACETMVKHDMVVIGGEISARPGVHVDHEAVVRQAVREIGYTDPSEPFCDSTLFLTSLITAQSVEIDGGVSGGKKHKKSKEEQGAGDQGIMFGYATDETRELMPLPILLAHKLGRGMRDDRVKARVSFLRPDAKTQVTVRYDAAGKPVRVEAVLVSTQHTAGSKLAEVKAYVHDDLMPRVLGRWNHDGIKLYVNPAGEWHHGGPSADAGLTGRKIIVDTYGGAAHHGGGAFSGKDPSKVDRSAAYYCRYVAREIVKAGLAHRAELQVAYAIGKAEPLSVKVDTFGTGDPRKAEAFVRSKDKRGRNRFDFRPGLIIEQLGLLKPIYRSTTNYGHFGKSYLPWEA